MMVDEFLISRVRGVAGRCIHDTESYIGLYRMTYRNIERYCSGMSKMTVEKYDNQIRIHNKCEKILLSFLVTHDIKESKRIIEGVE